MMGVAKYKHGKVAYSLKTSAIRCWPSVTAVGLIPYKT